MICLPSSIHLSFQGRMVTRMFNVTSTFLHYIKVYDIIFRPGDDRFAYAPPNSNNKVKLEPEMLNTVRACKLVSSQISCMFVLLICSVLPGWVCELRSGTWQVGLSREVLHRARAQHFRWVIMTSRSRVLCFDCVIAYVVVCSRSEVVGGGRHGVASDG